MPFSSSNLATLELNWTVVRAKHKLSGSFSLCYLIVRRPLTGAWIETSFTSNAEVADCVVRAFASRPLTGAWMREDELPRRPLTGAWIETSPSGAVHDGWLTSWSPPHGGVD